PDPDQRACRHNIVERNQIAGGDVDTTVRLRTPQGRLVAKTVDVDVASKGVDVSAAVQSRLQTLEPKDAVHDLRPGLTTPLQPDRLSGAKNGADWVTAADFRPNPVQAEWGLVGVFDLANAKGRGGNNE